MNLLQVTLSLLHRLVLRETDTALNHIFSSPSSESDHENEWEPCLPPPKRAKMVNMSLEKVAIIADRTGISHRNAALIATAALEDHGIVSKEDTSRVIDKSKVFRARLRTRACLREEASGTSQELVPERYLSIKKRYFSRTHRYWPKERAEILQRRALHAS